MNDRRVFGEWLLSEEGREARQEVGRQRVNLHSPSQLHINVTPQPPIVYIPNIAPAIAPSNEIEDLDIRFWPSSLHAHSYLWPPYMDAVRLQRAQETLDGENYIHDGIPRL